MKSAVVLKFLLAVIVLTGCAAPSQVMVNPKTWQQMDCSTWGFGWLGTPMALASYQDCINKSRAMGYITIEEAEATDYPKFSTISVTSSSPGLKPIWTNNSEWEYSVKGSTEGKKRHFRVLKKDIFRGQTVYVLLNSEGKKILYNDSLGTCAISNKGVIEIEYTPSLRPFDWPLTVGKSWKATGVMKTTTGKINLATFYEVTGFGRVKVPAGTFEAFHILGKNDTRRMRIVELWYSPKVRSYVKAITYQTGGRITEELTRYRLSKIDSSPVGNDIDAKLQKLKNLFDKGLINQDEYNNKKSELLKEF